MGVLAFIAFLTSFITARAFATLNPQAVLVKGGVHFHHFWYGLILITVAGWMGITNSLPSYKRLYAVLFGLGLGLIGDEIGLLLTFGNYNSSLTFFFFVVAVSIVAIVFLARDRKQIEFDVTLLKHNERLMLTGVAIIAGSCLFLGAGLYSYAVLVAGGGVVVMLVAWGLGRRTS